MELTQEQQQALALARVRARKRMAEAQADGNPWERFRDQGTDLKPWERAKRQQEEAQQKPSEVELARARARARAAQEQASEGRPWERYRDQSTSGKPWERFRDPNEVRVQSEFEALPWYGKAGRAVMDITRLGADGATFGFADKLAAGLDAAVTDRTYDQSLTRARELTGEARIRAGLAGDVAEIGASIMPMNAAANAGLSAARLVPQGLSRTKALGAKLIAGGVEGAGYGALHGAGHDEDIGDAASLGALAGIGGTAAAQAVGGVTQKLAQALKRHKPKVRSTEELTAKAQAADDAASLKEALDLRSRAAKSEAVESALLDADLAPNPERAIRARIGSLAKRDDLTPDEAMAVRDVAKGGLLRNSTRLTGQLLAPQGSLGSASTAAVVSGVLSGYPSALAAPVLGIGAKALSDRMTKGKAQRLAELMRVGGTRQALEGPDNLLQNLSKTQREALARALLAGELSLAPYAVGQD